jgi:hypothetical protein
MGLNLAVTAILVISGALVHAPGAVTAIISLTAALIAEILYLRKAGRALLAG